MKIKAGLIRNTGIKDLYEEIKAGYIDKMGFAFTVADESYDKATHTRSINGIKEAI